MLAKVTESSREREQPSKQFLLLQSEKERLMERIEDLEGRLNRESIDYKETIAELKSDKFELNKQLEEVQERLTTALKELESSGNNASAQAAADTKLQIGRIQQQFKEEK